MPEEEEGKERNTRRRRLMRWVLDYKPSGFQQKVLWAAITVTSLFVIGVFAIFCLWLLLWCINKLQPVIIPLAAAGVLAYIFDPFVVKLSRKFSRTISVTIVVLAFIAFSALLLTLVIVPTVGKIVETYEKKEEIQERTIKVWGSLKDMMNRIIIMNPLERLEAGLEKDKKPAVDEGANKEAANKDKKPSVVEKGPVDRWLENPKNIASVFGYVSGVVRGHLSAIPGLLIWFIYPILIPFFLWFILVKTRSIEKHWHEWLPLRASKFKTDIVETLTEISQDNLRPYFRGQMLVSTINAALTAILLLIFGLDHAVLIGCCMAFLGLLPMIGIVMCAVPAIVIALLQFSDPSEMRWGITSVWVYPLIVFCIFVFVQQIDGWFITPKVIGESTGLSDFEVILSIFFWGTVLGGFLGTLLAVPLTSSCKVLHKRYILLQTRAEKTG